MNIIIQAGGRGSRLESLTRNKPKCLVSINNLPIIFHLFQKYPTANFYIIADYKHDVLERYLAVFAKKYKYKIIKTIQTGTCSGVIDAIKNIPLQQKFMLIWCDLILSANFKVPSDNKNYVGISGNFECRWQYSDGIFKKEPSKQNGVAGLFIFNDKKYLEQMPTEGEFVNWLSTQNITFDLLGLQNSKEIGTMIAYNENNKTQNKCRPFNKIDFYEDYIVKTAITKQGEIIAKNETNWYNFMSKYNFLNIPKIYSVEPLKMEKIEGMHLFEYYNISIKEKREILKNILNTLNNLHNTDKPIEAKREDCIDNYLKKTFDRIDSVKKLIPFAEDQYIFINGKKYKNILYLKSDLEQKILNFIPEKFHIIHGDSTFSNILIKNPDIIPIFIDPRGYFGKTLIYGDRDYDFAKLYYSVVGNYDQFNNKNFVLEINENNINLEITSNGYEMCEDIFFEDGSINKEKIKLLHAIIWLSLTTFVWDDYDSCCAAFYNGLIYLDEVL